MMMMMEDRMRGGERVFRRHTIFRLVTLSPLSRYTYFRKLDTPSTLISPG
jgi:hypothetical protein